MVTRILNYIGLNDKTVAEFVINLHGQSKRLVDFKTKLKEVGAEFPESVVENMDRLILSMHPKYKRKAKNGNGKNAAQPTDEERRMFPGLAMPDSEWQPSFKADTKDIAAKEVETLMSELEGGAKKGRPKAADLMDRDDEPLTKKRRLSSMSPPRRRRSRSRDRDRDRDGDRHRSRSPPNRNGGSYEESRRGRDSAPRRARPDPQPVLFKIYNGKVTGLKDFGAFVTLEGVAGRFEGMASPRG